jgi:hypothetical protein
MENELIEIIKQLKSNPRRLVSVVNIETMKSIEQSVNAEKLTEKYGGVELFFNHLVENDITQISVTERLKNGSSSIAVGTPKIFNLKKKEVALPAEPAPVSSSVQTFPNMVVGLNGNYGLGIPELVNLQVRAQDRERVEMDNKYLKEKVERYEKEIAELKEERLQNKYNEAKAKGNNEMLMGILQIAPQLLGALKPQSPQGLSGVEDTPMLPEIPQEKQNIIATFSQTSPNIDAYMLAVLNGVNTHKEFYENLTNLLKEYKLID